jgi:hypothetical protein
MSDETRKLLGILGQLVGPRGVKAMREGGKVLEAAARFADVFLVPATNHAEDPHRILGVEPGDPWELVERVYRAKALVLHPDRQGTGNPEAFKRLKAAYEVLRDQRRRT